MIGFQNHTPLLTAHYSTEALSILYHYTSPEALIGIAINKEIWATSLDFLNDRAEAKHACSLVINVIENRIEREDFSEDARLFLDELKDMLGRGVGSYYISSFTELEDSLSQWRAYCPASGDYVIGIPSAQLKDMTGCQPFRLVKCVYDYNVQMAMVDEVLTMYLNTFESDPMRLERQGVHNRHAIKCSQHFSHLAVIMKHYTFEEEKEWRLISTDIVGSFSDLSFRASSKGIIPYMKFKLVNHEFPNLAKRSEGQMIVRLGPCVDHHIKFNAISLLLYKHVGQAALGHSDIPYKTW